MKQDVFIGVNEYDSHILHIYITSLFYTKHVFILLKNCLVTLIK